MNDDDLMRRISDGIDAPGGLDGDDALRDQLAADPDAQLYADDLLAIDEVLGGLQPKSDDRDWDALADAITARLDDDDAFDDIGDITAAPLFDEGLDVSGPVPAGRSIAPAEAEPTSAPVMIGGAVAGAADGPAPVVDLAEARRRRRTVFTLVGGLAAAAAVGLGITAGVTMSGDMSELESASPAFFEEEEEAAEAVAAADMDMEEAAAEEAQMGPGAYGGLADLARAEDAPTDEMPAEAAEAEAEPPMAALPMAAPSPDPAPSSSEVNDPWGGDRAFASERRLEQAMPEGAGGGADTRRAQAMRPRARPMRAAATPAPQPVAPPAQRSQATGGAEPTRVDTQEALARALGTVQRCMDGRHDAVANVTVTVRGRDGVITQANVRAPFAGTPEGACIERAVRQVRMPVSSRESYQTGHAYQPRPMAGSPAPMRPAARQRRAPAPSSDLTDPFE